MNERNQFSDSTPVDDSVFRLSDGDWTDFPPFAARESAFSPERAEESESGYERQIVDI